MRAWEAAANEPWAITETSLQTILEIAARDQKDDLEAVAARLGRPLQNTRTVTMRDGVATVPVSGPIFRHANLFTQISGATSIEMLAKDFTEALDNPEVSAIILNMDSPGGQVTGTAEFAEMVYQARGKKPVVAYVDGMAASAAYWIASAADSVVVSKTAEVGSIGVIGTVMDDSPKPGSGAYRFISSQSPNKRVDPSSDEGASQIQARIDDLAATFIADVARHRGVSAEDVAANFGRGAVVLPAYALSAGMVDEISTYEELHRRLAGQKGRVAHSPMVNAKETPAMTEATAAAPDTPVITAAYIAEAHADIAAAFRAEGAKAERDRLAGIDAVTLPGLEKIAAECKADIDCTPEAAAVKMVSAAKDPGFKFLATQRANDDALPAIAPAVEPVAAEPALDSLPLKDRCEKQWKSDPELRAEFADNFEAFVAFEENKSNVRILRREGV